MGGYLNVDAYDGVNCIILDDSLLLASSYTATCQLGRVRLRDSRLWCDDRPPPLDQWADDLGALRERVRRITRGQVEAQPTAAQPPPTMPIGRNAVKDGKITP